MVDSWDQYWIAGARAGILAGELKIFTTSRVVGVCHEVTLELVWEVWQVNATLAVGQSGGRKSIPVCVCVTCAVPFIHACDGKCSVQRLLSCAIIRTPANHTVRYKGLLNVSHDSSIV